MSKVDFLIVGSGFFGSTFARKATDAGKTCLVIDKLPHVGGAAADFEKEGIMISRYGAHIFHTHNEEIWNFINQFGTIEPFINKPKVLSGNKVYSFPINLMTLHQLWGVVTPEEARKKLKEVCIPCEDPRNFEEWALSKIGKQLYELFIYGYTKKQWGKEPRELPSSIIQRLPIRLNYEENYFTTKYQGMPKEGFSQLVENMLDGIDYNLEVDFFDMKDNWQNFAKHLIYTGPVDKYFDYQFGKLEYNTMRFEYKIHYGNYQGNAVFNHVDLSTPYLRSIEYQHFRPNYQKHYDINNQDKNPSVISFDYPVSFKDHPEPYYPIRDDKNNLLYEKYSELKKSLPNVTFGGRIGEYKYLDIDQTIASALQKTKKFL